MKVIIIETSKKQKGQIPKLIKRHLCLVVNKGVNLRRKYGPDKELNHMIKVHQ